MPCRLDDLLKETFGLLADEPDAEELVVVRARHLCNAQVNGSYENVLTMLGKY
ncbi:hypothetical protein [Mycolicibacterium wolinskyi]|uniref:hypothetical protein n=1 Tax=Mycolicibacterium wolinskyi TaxID=59750 RepID=UPI000A4FC40B|nr:hypothetical protein [Mycolicibacterium wolinskyi]